MSEHRPARLMTPGAARLGVDLPQCLYLTSSLMAFNLFFNYMNPLRTIRTPLEHFQGPKLTKCSQRLS